MDSLELKNSLNDLKIRLDDIKDGVFDLNGVSLNPSLKKQN